ncbi:MAG: rod shape-determining protein RodA [Heliobacteriaceae bacterium]|nr:rod shape-determining protein RodA [Heliobacteriaceae bacterium]MDD4586914.1 rod shape-determining protein RodA [Heliobacteriaceae bacterium]
MDLKHVRNIDFTLIVVVGLLLAFGLVILSSASGNVGREPLEYVRKQVFWIGAGTLVIASIMFFRYQTAARYAWHLYVFNILILLAVLVFAEPVKGAYRWIPIGGFQFQPSEFSKLLLILTFADFLAKRKDRLNTFKDLLPCFAFVAIPMALILKQPDLGTSLVFVAIMMGMLLAAGANKRLLAVLCGGGLLVVALALYGHFAWHWPLPLKEYQIQRLIIFLDPDMDPMVSGYHIRQSLIAIGSGGLLGKGLYNGSQAQLNFLPEHHTDFIFSVVGEELGFVGVAALLCLFLIFILRALRIALEARDTYGTLIVVGVMSMFLFHIMINIGMTAGIMPVTGIPLPFISYGGSAMLTNMMSLGILINVSLRKQTILF